MDYRNKATFIFFIMPDGNKYRCIYENELVAEEETIEGVKERCRDYARRKSLNENVNTVFFKAGKEHYKTSKH